MPSSKGLLRHLAQQQRLWSSCSPLSVITRQTATPAVSAVVPQGIFRGSIFSRGLTSLVNGQAKPLNSRRDNGRPMPIGIRRYVAPVLFDTELYLPAECAPPRSSLLGCGIWDRPTPHRGVLPIPSRPRIITLLSNLLHFCCSIPFCSFQSQSSSVFYSFIPFTFPYPSSQEEAGSLDSLAKLKLRAIAC
jgi:hypothetical protein